MRIISTHQDATKSATRRSAQHRQPPKLWKTTSTPAEVKSNDALNDYSELNTEPALCAALKDKRTTIDRRRQQIMVSIDHRRQQRRHRRLSKAEKILRQLQKNSDSPSAGRWINETV